MAQKESERFREFAEKFVLARAPDGPEGVWQAVLDAKTAFKQVIQATEEYAKPERELAAAERDAQASIRQMQQKMREQELLERYKLEQEKIVQARPYAAAGGVVVTQLEDKPSWRNEFLKRFDKLGKAAPQWSQYLDLEPGTGKTNMIPDPSSQKP